MALRCVSPALALLTLAAACGFDASSVRADEAFLCGPDTVVYVKPEELELKKRTDPCIARYFGLSVETDAAAAGPAPSASPVSGSKQAAVTRAAPKDIALKSLQSPETAERVTPPAPQRSASLQPPVAAPGTDYRNVRVINASSASDQWFKHTR